MAFCHLSSLHNLCTSIPFPKFGPSPLKLRSHQTLARRNLVLACSAEKSSKKGKPSRARKNDEEIRKELWEFMSVMGLSEDHVPSTKELLEHGRRDLANIVRRRGYKAIMELLRHSSGKGIDREKSSHGNQDISSACRDEVSEDQERNLNNSGECFSTSDSSMEENYFVKANGSACNSVWICEPSESSLRSLQLEATSFTHTGVMEIIEDDSEESTDMPTDFEVNPNILNSNNADMASMDPRQAPFSSMEYQPDSNGTASGEVLDSADFDVDVASDMAAEKDNQIEIDRLKSILHKKEMELSLLKQQVEKEKQALSDLQAKANVEIVNARRVLSAKDVELHAAEESLLGLKEVQIEYWADCESVEVAGSFNGWHHRVKLDLHPSSYTINPPESRKSKLWSTTLWLYPGLYEIKFIVDGHWRTDSQRESITSGSITNNILRVDR